MPEYKIYCEGLGGEHWIAKASKKELKSFKDYCEGEGDLDIDRLDKLYAGFGHYAGDMMDYFYVKDEYDEIVFEDEERNVKHINLPYYFKAVGGQIPLPKDKGEYLISYKSVEEGVWGPFLLEIEEEFNPDKLMLINKVIYLPYTNNGKVVVDDEEELWTISFVGAIYGGNVDKIKQLLEQDKIEKFIKIFFESDAPPEEFKGIIPTELGEIEEDTTSKGYECYVYNPSLGYWEKL